MISSTKTLWRLTVNCLTSSFILILIANFLDYGMSGMSVGIALNGGTLNHIDK